MTADRHLPLHQQLLRPLCRLLPLMALALAACPVQDDDDITLPPDQHNQQTYPGDYYKDFLTADTYTKLLIEVDVVEGAVPDDGAMADLQESIDTLKGYVGLLCNKPGGIQVLLPDDTIPSPGEDPTWTLNDINDLAEQYRDHYRSGDTAVLHFLYVNGHSDYDDPEEGTQVVGYAYHGSSMAIFMGVVNSKPPIVASSLLKTVTIHEFGHELGLVENPISMVSDHLDPDESHGPHCNNSSCMMYWLNNSSVANLLTGDLPDFDDACLADLAQAGGKDASGQTQPN